MKGLRMHSATKLRAAGYFFVWLTFYTVTTFDFSHSYMMHLLIKTSSSSSNAWDASIEKTTAQLLQTSSGDTTEYTLSSCTYTQLIHFATALPTSEFIRPEKIVFYSTSDRVFPADQPELVAGVSAAFLEANEAGVLGATELVAEIVDVNNEVNLLLANGVVDDVVARIVPLVLGTEQPADNTSNTARPSRSVMGFVANSQLTGFGIPVAVSQALAGDTVNIAINSVVEGFNEAHNIINLKGFISVENPVLIDFAYMRDGMHCTDFFVIHIEAGDMKDVKKQFEINGFGESAWVERPAAGEPNLSELLTKFYNGGKPHSCILLLDVAAAVEPMIKSLKSLPFFRAGTPILTLSYGVKPVFSDPYLFDNVFATQVVPSPYSTTSPFVARYRRAITHYFASDPSRRTNSMGLNVSGVPNYQSLEGYIAGRMIVDAAKATLNLTRKNLLETIYRQRMFKFEDFSIGPYTDECTMERSFPCKCTAGLRSVYIAQVDPATGTAYGLVDRPELGEVDTALRTAESHACLDRAPLIRRAFNVLMPHWPSYADFIADIHQASSSSNSSSADLRWQSVQRFSDALRNATYSYNLMPALRSIGSVRLVTRPHTGASPFSQAKLDADSYRYRPYAIAGLPTAFPSPTSSFASVPLLLSTPMMGIELLSAPPSTANRSSLSSVSAAAAASISIFGALSDHIHALVAMVVQRRIDVGTIGVVSDSVETLNLVRSSFETFGYPLPAEATAILSVSSVVTDAVGNAQQREYAIGNATYDVVRRLMIDGLHVLVASQIERVVVGAVTAAADPAPVSLRTSVASPSLFVAAEESLVYYAAVPKRQALSSQTSGSNSTTTVPSATPTTTTATTASLSRAVYFASVMPAWWSTSTVFGNTVASRGVLLETSPSLSAPSRQTLVESPATAKAVFAAQFLYESALVALQLYDSTSRAPTMAETIFTAGTFTVGGVTLGPFSNVTCNTTAEAESPTRTCECGKGPRLVYVHSMNDLLSGYTIGGGSASSGGSSSGSTTATYYTLQLQGCGVRYVPLPADGSRGSDSATLIGAVAASASVVVGALCVVLLSFVFCAGRSNRSAPKDETKPFGMVFTDIQSSTTLWARDPSGMAAAVDLHHAVLRKALQRHNGYEVKIIGDSFMAAFCECRDAVAFALTIQTDLFEAPWANGDFIDDTYVELAENDAQYQKILAMLATTGAGGTSAGSEADASDFSKAHSRGGLIGGGGMGLILGSAEFGSVVNTTATHHPQQMPPSGPHSPAASDLSVDNHNKAKFGKLQLQYTSSPNELLSSTSIPPSPAAGPAEEAAETKKNNNTDRGTANNNSNKHLWRGLRVRVGVHFGIGRIQKDQTSGGYDYYGTVVNTAARVEGVGHGGQVLATQAVIEELLGEEAAAAVCKPKMAFGSSPAAAGLATCTVDMSSHSKQPRVITGSSSPRGDAAAEAGADEPNYASGGGGGSGSSSKGSSLILTIASLGPQPLRGLPAPIALFQLTPKRFSRRVYPPLRLDVENALDDDEDEDDEARMTNDEVDDYGGGGGGWGGADEKSSVDGRASALKGAATTPSLVGSKYVAANHNRDRDETMSQRSARGGRGGGTLTAEARAALAIQREGLDDKQFLAFFNLVKTLLSASKPQWQTQTLKSLANDWKVKLPKNLMATQHNTNSKATGSPTKHGDPLNPHIAEVLKKVFRIYCAGAAAAAVSAHQQQLQAALSKQQQQPQPPRMAVAKESQHQQQPAQSTPMESSLSFAPS